MKHAIWLALFVLLFALYWLWGWEAVGFACCGLTLIVVGFALGVALGDDANGIL